MLEVTSIFTGVISCVLLNNSVRYLCAPAPPTLVLFFSESW